jgi:hypothetical protein
MSDPDVQIRALLRRTLAEAEASSDHHAGQAIGPRRRAFGRALPVAVALVTAAALVAGILTIGPRLHPTAVAVHPTPRAVHTLLPSLAPTALPTTLPTAPPLPAVVIPTPRPTPTPVPWSPPPQTVTEPQLLYMHNGQYQHLVEMDWTGTVHGALSPQVQGCEDCMYSAMRFPAPYIPSPDGSRVILNGSDIVGPDGSSKGSLAKGAEALSWDGDNRHLCRLDGPGSSVLSWVTPDASRPVATLPVDTDDFWWILACSSTRNRIVVVRLHAPYNSPMTILDLRSVELSTGRVIHDKSGGFNGYGGPSMAASGDGTVVAFHESTTSTSFYDPDSGALLHVAPYLVVRLSWYGGRALAAAGGHSVMLDWRHDLVLWTDQATGGRVLDQWWSRELSDDLSGSYTTSTDPQQWRVVIVKSDGTSSSYNITTS